MLLLLFVLYPRPTILSTTELFRQVDSNLTGIVVLRLVSMLYQYFLN